MSIVKRKETIKSVLLEVLAMMSIASILYIITESDSNLFVSIFDATKNNLYTDFKIIMIATYIYTFASFVMSEKRDKNLWSAITIKILIQSMLYLTTLNYFRFEPLYIKSIILAIVIAISTIVEKVILRYVNTSSKLDELLKYVNVFGILFFIMFLLFC